MVVKSGEKSTHFSSIIEERPFQNSIHQNIPKLVSTDGRLNSRPGRREAAKPSVH